MWGRGRSRHERPRALPSRPLSSTTRGLTLRGWNLARFHQLLEAAEIFTNRLVRFFAEHLRHGRAELAARRVVLQVDGDARAVRILVEVDGARGRDRRAGERLPADHFILHFVDDARVPFDARPRGTSRHPVRDAFLAHRDPLEMFHELREVLEVPPEAVELADRPADGHRLFHEDATAPAELGARIGSAIGNNAGARSEEHTSELQSLAYLVCRL